MDIARDLVAPIAAALRDRADPARAEPMAAYMRGRFPFLGVPAPARREATRAVLATLPPIGAADALAAAALLWDLEEREHQHVACDLLVRAARRLPPDALPALERLITSRSWWDTVDALATRVVGRLVLDHPELRPEMDRWLDAPERWLARAAILHQERWRERTDATWLFAAAARRAGDRDFFIRKAIGWALRSYARTDPAAVRAFVEAQGDRLSGLSRREALRGVARALGSA